MNSHLKSRSFFEMRSAMAMPLVLRTQHPTIKSFRSAIILLRRLQQCSGGLWTGRQGSTSSAEGAYAKTSANQRS